MLFFVWDEGGIYNLQAHRILGTLTWAFMICVIWTPVAVCVDTELPALMVVLDGNILRVTAIFGWSASVGRFMAFGVLTSCSVVTFWLYSSCWLPPARNTTLIFELIITISWICYIPTSKIYSVRCHEGRLRRRSPHVRLHGLQLPLRRNLHLLRILRYSAISSARIIL